MKISMLLTVFIVIGCVLATGCIEIKSNPVNATPTTTPVPTATPTSTPTITPTFTPTNTFTPFETEIIPANVTNTTGKLQGPLRVSISGYPADLPLVIDNQTVGIVSKEKPLDLMVDEGVHHVMVCVGSLCERETVTIVFAKKTYIDFGERLKRDVQYPNPTVRITEFYRFGQGVIVNLEFINPSTKDLSITTEVSCGYSYIDSRTNQKMGDSVRGKVTSFVGAGERKPEQLTLYFSYGGSYSFDPPQIQSVTYK